MKKIICILFALLLIVALSIPAYAASPRFSIPKLPKIPDITNSVKIELPENYWHNYFKNHTFRLDFSGWRV